MITIPCLWGILLCTVTVASPHPPTSFHEKRGDRVATESRSMKYSEKPTINGSTCYYNPSQISGGFALVVYDGDGSDIRSLFDNFRRCVQRSKFCVVTIQKSSAGNGFENTAWYSCVSNSCTDDDVRISFQLQQTADYEVKTHCNHRSDIGLGFWVTITIVCISTVTTVIAFALQECLLRKRSVEKRLPIDRKKEDRGGRARKKGLLQPQILVTCPSGSGTSNTETEATGAIATVDWSSTPRKTFHCSWDGLNMKSRAHTLGHQSVIGDIEVHRTLSSQSLTTLPGKRNNNNGVSSEDGLAKSFSDLSLNTSSKESLQFSNPSVFVSPLQDNGAVLSEISLIGHDDLKTSSANYSERNIEAITNKRHGIISTLLPEYSLFRPDRTTCTERQSQVESQVSCLYAIQVITVWWIILRETTKFMATSPVVENSAVVFNQPHGEWLWAGSLHWHTFFLTNAMLDMILLDTTGSGSSICNSFIEHLCRKILRQTPHVAIIVLVWTYVIPTCGEGPFWYAIQENNCKDMWWSSILYASNFYPNQATLQCLPWSWFVACDMQMYVVGLFFAMLISKHPKLGTIGLVASIIAVSTMDLLIGYDHAPSGSDQHHDNSTDLMESGAQTNGEAIFNVSLSKPYYHWITYATGIILLTTTRRITVRRTSAKIALTVLSAICIVGIIVLSMFAEKVPIYSKPGEHYPLIMCGLQLCWVTLLVPIVLVLYNIHQGCLHRILAVKFWRTIGRLNLCCVLTSPIILMWFTYGLDYTIRLSKLSLSLYFLALITAVYLGSFATFLFIQRPAEAIVVGVVSWFKRNYVSRRSNTTSEWRRWKTPVNGNLPHGKARPFRARDTLSATSLFQSIFTPELRTRYPSTM